MTAQLGERLLYQGKEVSMCTEPLGQYFALGGDRPSFSPPHTALWRGYVGTWEILNDRLYLIGLSGHLEDGSEASLATLFPDYPERVFAHWFTGTLRIPEGRLIEYVHAGYGSQYEHDRMIEITNGVVTKVDVIENGKGEGPAEGYGPGAWTTLAGDDEARQ